jgi:hypothetical protein
MNRSSFVVRLCLFAITVASCGGGDKKLELGGACSLNSDCTGGLTCKFGACHKACVKSVDCATGERCVQVDNAAVCQLATEAACAKDGTCKAPLMCRTADNTCRNQCVGDGDCLSGQTCSSTVCIETKELVPVSGLDAGAGLDGSAGLDAVSASPDLTVAPPDTARADVSVVVLDTPPVDIATVLIDTAGASSDGAVTVPPDLQPTKWDTALPAGDATIAVTAVASPVSARAGEEITVTVAGTGLTTPDQFTLGGKLVDKAAVSGASDVAFTVKVTVPHGLAPSIVDFGFVCRGGQAVATAVLQITPIVVSLDGADTNRGTPDFPFRTVTKAVQTAGTGDTLEVAGGEFTTGETWPLTLPDKVALMGAGVAQTTLAGPGNTTTKGIVLSGDGTIGQLALRQFGTPLTVAGAKATVMLENVDAVTSGMLILELSSTATGASVTAAGKQTSFSSPSILVQVLAGYCTLTLRDGQFMVERDGYQAVVVGASNSTTNLTVEDATFGAAPGTAGSVELVYPSACFSTSVNTRYVRAAVRGFQRAGIASCSTLSGTTSIQDSKFLFPGDSVGIKAPGFVTANGSSFEGGTTQIDLAAGLEGTFRNCSFSLYGKAGIGAAGSLDLGTAMELGSNVFTGSSVSGVYGLSDVRPAASLDTITVSGTSFNGVFPPAGIVTKSTVLAACQPGAYCITTNGNSITFY